MSLTIPRVRAACPQVYSSGGTCTLLPSFLGVHPNFWGCNVPFNSSFGGTKKMNCIFLISHVQFLYVVFFKHMKYNFNLLLLWVHNLNCYILMLKVFWPFRFICQSWHWFTNISYIIVRIGTVIVAVTVMFSFNSFISIFGNEIIQGSLHSIIPSRSVGWWIEH